MSATTLDAIARAFWLPRIEPALRWAAEQVWGAEGREPLAVEAQGEITVDGAEYLEQSYRSNLQQKRLPAKS